MESSKGGWLESQAIRLEKGKVPPGLQTILLVEIGNYKIYNYVVKYL